MAIKWLAQVLLALASTVLVNAQAGTAVYPSFMIDDLRISVIPEDGENEFDTVLLNKFAVELRAELQHYKTELVSNERLGIRPECGSSDVGWRLEITSSPRLVEGGVNRLIGNLGKSEAAYCIQVPTTAFKQFEEKVRLVEDKYSDARGTLERILNELNNRSRIEGLEQSSDLVEELASRNTTVVLPSIFAYDEIKNTGEDAELAVLVRLVDRETNVTVDGFPMLYRDGRWSFGVPSI